MRRLILIILLSVITYTQSGTAKDAKWCKENEKIFAIAYGQSSHADYVFNDTDKLYFDYVKSHGRWEQALANDKNKDEAWREHFKFTYKYCKSKLDRKQAFEQDLKLMNENGCKIGTLEKAVERKLLSYTPLAKYKLEDEKDPDCSRDEKIKAMNISPGTRKVLQVCSLLVRLACVSETSGADSYLRDRVHPPPVLQVLPNITR